MSEQITQVIITGLIEFATGYLILFMFVVFCLGFFMRTIIYYTVRREWFFVKEFTKRVREYYSDRFNKERSTSFYIVASNVMRQAFHDVFEKRRIYMRRKPDHIMSMSDRVFLVEDGVSRLVKDTLSQIKYCKRESHTTSMMLETSKAVFENNPVFNRVFGIIPLNLVNEFLNILPGLFIIGGIFGTFLGIMKALPALGNMELSDPAGTKEVMDIFLLKISFSMSTSIVGILLSVAMTSVNTIFSPEGPYYKLVNQFTNTMNLIWNETKTNLLPERVNRAALKDKRI